VSLRFLEVDVFNAFCPYGCCRQPDCGGEYIYNVRSDRVAVLGAGVEEQLNVLHNLCYLHELGDPKMVYYQPGQVKELNNIKFDPEETWVS
jgi:hypothetical protein